MGNLLMPSIVFWLIILMDQIQRYLDELEDALFKEAAIQKKHLNEKYKPELSALLRSGAPFEDITNFVNTKVGKKLWDWWLERLKDIYDKLKAKRLDIFGIFVRKTRISQFIDEQALNALETSMYQRKVDNIKEILKSRLPEGAQDKYINLGIDWAMGKDIPSDKEEDQEKLSAENIQILSDFLKNKLNQICVQEEDIDKAIKFSLDEDFEELATIISDYDPAESEGIVEEVKTLLKSFKQKKSVPTFTEKDKNLIKEFLTSELSFLEEEDIDKSVQALCRQDWEQLKNICEGNYGEEEINEEKIPVFKDFMAQQFEHIINALPKEVPKPVKKQVPKQVPIQQTPPPKPYQNPSVQPITYPVEPIKSEPNKVFPQTEQTGLDKKSSINWDDVGIITTEDRKLPPRSIPEDTRIKARDRWEDNTEPVRPPKPPEPPKPTKVYTQVTELTKVIPPILTKVNPVIEPFFEPRPPAPQTDEDYLTDDMSADIERMLKEIDDSLAISLKMNIDEPRIEELRTEEQVLEFDAIPLDVDWTKSVVNVVPEDQKPAAQINKKKIFILLKMDDMPKNRDHLGFSYMLKLNIQGKRQHYTENIFPLDKYILYCFEVPPFEQLCWFSYHTSTMDRPLNSDSFPGKGLEPIYHFLFQIPWNSRDTPDFVKMELIQEAFVTSLLLQKDSDLLGLIGFIDGKTNIKARLNTNMRGFKDNKDMYIALNYFKDCKQVFYMYYLFAHTTFENLLSASKPVKQNFNEKLIMDCKQFNNRFVTKELQHLDNEFRLALLKIHSSIITEEKNFSILSELFNGLMNNFSQNNLIGLIHVLYLDNQNIKRKLNRIDLNRLREIIRRQKTSLLEYLYFMCVMLSADSAGKVYNCMGKYIEMLNSIRQKINENVEHLPQSLRPCELSFRQAISKEARQIYKNRFEFDYDNNVRKLFEALSALPKVYVDLLDDQQLEKVIRQAVNALMMRRSKQSVDLINLVYIAPQQLLILSWKSFQNTAKLFFHKLTTRRVISWRGDTEQTVYEKAYIQDEVLEYFVKLVYYPIVLNRYRQMEKKILTESIIQCMVVSSYDFRKIARILNNPLVELDITPEKDPRKSLQSVYQQIFSALARNGRYNQSNLIDTQQWLQIIKLQDPLRTYLLGNLVRKVKFWRSSIQQHQKSLVDKMAESVMSQQGMGEEQKDDIMFSLLGLNDETNITKEEIRKVLSEHPLRAKQFLRCLDRGSYTVKNLISQYTQEIKEEIERKRITRSTIVKMLTYKQDTWTHITHLFDRGHCPPIRQLIKDLSQKCREFMEYMKRISSICKSYAEVRCLWEVDRIAETKYMEFSNGDSFINFEINPQLYPFNTLKPAVYSFYNFKPLKERIHKTSDMSVQDFCRSLDKGMGSLLENIGDIINRYRKGTLLMSEIQPLLKSTGSPEQLKKLLKAIEAENLNRISDEEIDEMNSIMKYNNSFKSIYNLFRSLRYIATRANEPFRIDSSVLEKIEQQKFAEVLAGDFLANMMELDRVLLEFELRAEEFNNDINKILEMTSRSQALWAMTERFTLDQIEELKDYMSEQDNNSLQAKNVSEFEYIYRYYTTVLKPANSIRDYLTKLQAFLDQQTKSKNSESLAASLESCISLRTQLLTLIELAGNREQSYKFIVSDIMEQSVVMLRHDPETEEKEVEVLNDKHKKITFDKLSEWRDKSLLLMNNAKKNMEDVKKEDLDKLKNFVDMYESLSVVLISYNKLMNLGYFQNFIHISIRDQFGFKIVKNSFRQIQNHNQIVKEQCKKWEKQIDQAYANSFAFSHFQGKDLKKLAKRIFSMNFDPMLKKILPSLTEETFLEYFRNRDVACDFQQARDKNRPSKQLKFMTNMFDYFQMRMPVLARMNSSGEKTFKIKDNEIPIRIVALDQKIGYLGMLTPGKQALRDINMPQILLCRSNTSLYEIKTFLMRAILDSSRPYYVIGTHYLNAQNQNNFCKIIELALEHPKLKNDIRRMNLYMIDNATNEKIYNYFAANHKDKVFKIVRTEDVARDAHSYFEEKAGKLVIVDSPSAALGKTFWIESQIKQQGRQPKYFPLAGNLDFAKIYRRVQNLKLDNKSALVIQIHNIKDKKVLDEFLFQVVFFRCLKHDGFLYLPEDLPIYIELQNILNQKPIEELQVLRILSRCPRLCNKMPKVKAESVIIQPTNHNAMFVLKYLELLKMNELDKHELNYEDFVKKLNENPKVAVAPEKIKDLIDEYLFKPLHQMKNDPSYIQLQSFLSLMFESLRVFSSSPFYSLDIMKHYTKQFSGCGFQTYRSKHIMALVKNSRQFLFRTITQTNFTHNQTPEELEEAQAFTKRLREFPFLIVPNADQVGYSFVYKQAQHVDPIIRKYTCLQNNVLTHTEFNNDKAILAKFTKTALTSLNMKDLHTQMLQMLKSMAYVNTATAKILPDPNYSLTLDNFYKMCLIVLRMRANIPIIVMGETGVGKTALIRYLVENVFRDQLKLFDIHAGVAESHLIGMVKEIRQESAKIQNDAKKKLWVFFDEFNTSEEVGYIKEIIMERRFMGEALPNNVVFLAACNPYRTRQQGGSANQIKVGIKKNPVLTGPTQAMLYKVLPPPESMIEIMWNFQELKAEQSRIYIQTILSSIPYRTADISKVIHDTHQMFKREVEKSAVNLRDVSRFKILYQWFIKFMPTKAVHQYDRRYRGVDYNHNYNIDRQERAFILSLCFCYYMRLGSFEKRKQYLSMVQKQMGYQKDRKDIFYIQNVLKYEQIDYLSRMRKPDGCALNLALRENVFTCFVCLMNKLPIIIVGMPGCSKSLAIRLLVSNLRGKHSQDDFFKLLPELQLFPFQGGEACRSEGVIQVFDKSEKNQRPNSIPCILFDEIGLAELSVHNPLKVLHSRLEVNKTKVAFIGISNWELDASKMARFLVINRPLPDEYDLIDTAEKIFESYDGIIVDNFEEVIKPLSKSYFRFMSEWKSKQNNDHPDFFGLRDFYSLIKYVCVKIIEKKISKDQQRIIAEIMRRAVERNFDGRPDSIKMFLRILNEIYKHQALRTRDDDPTDILGLIAENIEDKNSRCLLQIVKGEALIYIINQKQVGIDKKSKNNIIMIHGSTFEQDQHSSEHNLVVISDIINYVARGDVIVMKDVPNSVQTSLYDLLNKSFQIIGKKNYCRIAVGAHYNPKCFVHPNFNCIVNIMENRLMKVDPPFLNRFQKHYLTFDQFLSVDENFIIRELESWIEKLLKDVLKKENPLLKEHYIVNVCRQSLASLAIKQIMEAPAVDGEEIDVKKCLVKAKHALLLNSTTDFRLLMSYSMPQDEADSDLINQGLALKDTFIKEEIHNVNKLIVYTYDETVEIYDDNILFEKDKTKVIKICELKCEKDLRNDLDNFYRNDDLTVCHLKMNFEKESKHLCMIVFMLDSMAKKHEQPNKRVIIILVISRLTLLNNVKGYKQISYLNGFKQIFIEGLSRDSIAVDELPIQGDAFLKKKPTFFNFDQIIPRLFSSVIKRFDFALRYDQKQEVVRYFTDLLLNMSENDLFKKLSSNYLLGRFKQRNNKNWKMEVITNKQIANLAPTTELAMRLVMDNRLEEDLAIYLNFLIENEVIYCFDPKLSLDILKVEIPESQEIQGKLLDTLKHPYYDQILEHLLTLLCPNPSKQMRRISKAVGSERIQISFPKLFPFSRRERAYILQKERNQEDQENKENDVKGEDTLEDMCDRIDEIDRLLKEKKNPELVADLEGKIKEAEQFIMKKTRLAQYTQQGREYDYIEDMNRNVEWRRFKDLFMFDIINCFLSSSLQANLRQCIELRKILRYFVPDEARLEEQLIILLRGESLWKKLVIILRVFREAGLIHQLGQFWEGFEKIQLEKSTQLESFQTRIEFMKWAITRCDLLLFPSKENMDNLEGFKNYEFIFNNVYYILEGLENEYRNFGVQVPFQMRLMRNFLKTIGNISEDERQQLVKKFCQQKETNIYIRINNFIEEIKATEIISQVNGRSISSKKYQNKIQLILKYQAGNLYMYWIRSIQQKKIKDGPEIQLFTRQLIKLINSEEDFAHNCSDTIGKLLKHIELEAPIAEICEEISDQRIEGNIILSEISKNVQQANFNNNLSVVLVDFFCRNTFVPDPEVPMESSTDFDVYCVECLFPQFQEFMKKIQDEQINALQTAAFLGFSRQFLSFYVQCFCAPKEQQEKVIKINELMVKIDEILCRPTKVCENLRLFCLKMIRSKQKSLRDVIVKYINVVRANWPRFLKEQFTEVPSKQFVIPPDSDQHLDMDALIKDFFDKGYKDMGILSRMLQYDNPVARYKLLTFFMTDIYSNLCGNEAREMIMNQLKKQLPPHITVQEMDLLQRYTTGKVTDHFEYPQDQDISILNNQTWILNNINWLLSIRKSTSPLTSIFFDKNGDIPKNFAEHINSQFLIAGKDNPFRSIIESIASATPFAAFYICSNKCDFVYTVEGCGWPAGKSKCKFCEMDISGDGHQLLRTAEGARRLGTDLCFSGGKFVPGNYAAGNTYHGPFYLGGLQKVDYYWKSIPAYLRKEIDRIIEKPQVKTHQKKIIREENNRVVNDVITHRMTGYSKFSAEGLSRIHAYTNHVLLIILNSLMYFFISLKWIPEEECPKIFDNRSSVEMIDHTFNVVSKEASKLKDVINHGEWMSWLMGMEKIVFELAQQYQAEYENAYQEKLKTNIVEIKKMEESKNALSDNTHKMLIDNIIRDGVVCDFPKVDTFTAHRCWNRDFFEKLVEAKITKLCSGEDKITFIKNSRNQKGNVAYPFDAVLTEENIEPIAKFNYLRVLRLAINPSLQHMTKEYSIKISNEYPILSFLLDNKEKIDTIGLFWNVCEFVNEITPYVEFSISRGEAKTIKIADFIKRQKIDDLQKKQLTDMMNRCCESWNKLAKKNGAIQYECKVLGVMNENYSSDQPLIAFLVDSLEASNYYGKMMSGVLHLFAATHNELITTIEARKMTIPQMRDVQLFSQSQYLPQKITKNDIIKIDDQTLTDLVESASSSSVKYSNGIPLYNLDLIQYKLTNQLYGKKRLVTDMKHYINVQFSGQSFSRAGKYSNYITEIRQIGAHKALQDPERIREKFQDIKQKDENNFYNFMKSIQGFIEKMMIFYKNLQDKNISIGKFIEHYGFRNPPDIMVELPIKGLPIECIVSLYEEVESTISSKIFSILPDDYKLQKLSQDQRERFNQFFTRMKAGDPELPKFEEFKAAFYRLASRCLMLAQIPNSKMLMEFLMSRLDFWPYDFDDDKRDCLQARTRCDLELSKVFDLYDIIENFGKPQIKGGIKVAAQDQEKIDINKAKGVIRKPLGKKKEFLE